MGRDFGGRLTRLAQAYYRQYGDWSGWGGGSGGDDEQTRLTALYEGFRELPGMLGETWKEGTAEKIMRALVRDETYTFTAFDAQGNRSVTRIGPLLRDQRTGRIRWSPQVGAVPFASERVSYDESYADGLPSSLISTHLPDGSWWDARQDRRPTPRQLRRMVVERARREGDIDVLDVALRQGGQHDGWEGWLAEAEAEADDA